MKKGKKSVQKGKKSVQKDDVEPIKSKKGVPKNDAKKGEAGDGETSKKSRISTVQSDPGDGETSKKSRISTVQSDPVFHEMRKRDKKIKVDSRFKAMFEDERFASTTAKVDRHGRPINKLKNREDLRNLYELEEDSDSSDKEKDEEQSVVKPKLKKIDLARGEGNISSSSEDEEEYSGDELNEEDCDKLGIHDKWGELDHGVRKVEWTSKRLAVCNLDWEKMTAEDIFVALESFKPEDGQITSVEVYLSDFGAEQLKYEEEHGPKLPEHSLPKNDAGSDQSDNDGEDAKPEVIRAYQFDRFRFYYAVVSFDSDATANAIYENCDGVQYQSSGLALDLRFVPDEMEFDKTRLRDQCLPDSVNLRKYKPNHFQSSVTRSNVKLDWDNPDFHRQKKVQRAFDNETNFDDLTGLIASGSDNDEDREEEDEGASVLLSAAATSNVYNQKPRNYAADNDHEMEADEKPKPKETKKSKLKMKLVTKKKRKLADMATNLPANLDDSRFSALYSNSEFAIDKTNPHYKGGVLADVQVQEKIRRKK